MHSNKFPFDENQLQCGDIIEKPDGRRFIVCEKNIYRYLVRSWFANRIEKVVTTYIEEIKEVKD